MYEMSDHVRMLEVTRSLGFDIIPVTGNGDCFFTSVSVQLLQILSDCPNEHRDFLQSLGITAGTTSDELAQTLWTLVVDEWLSNRDEYRSFFAGIELKAEPARFRRGGEFAGALGDALPIGMSNVLRIPILIFTTVHNMPIVSVTLRVTLNNAVICVSYLHEGPVMYCGLLSS